MKKSIFVLIILCIACVSFAPVEGQGMLYVSNLGQTPTDMGLISSDSWIAQPFVTGSDSNGYALNSIQLLMDSANGIPNGFRVSLYSSQHNGVPGTSLVNLSGSDPSSGGIFTYIAPGLQLSPDTGYFVVLTASTPQAQGAYNWSAAYRAGVGSSTTGWSIQDYYYSSLNGSTWSETIRQDVFQMAIYGAPVPEPNSNVLAGLVLMILGISRWRNTKK